MTQAVHIVLQGKGGVGKSVVSRLLLEYMIAKDMPYAGFDADPVNQTFSAHPDRNVTPVDLLVESRINSKLFDKMIEDIAENNDKSIIIDTGASSFLPFIEYIYKEDVVETLQDEGFSVFFHTVVTGGTSSRDTIVGFIQLAEKFGNRVNLIVWENEYFGPIKLEGKPFMEVGSVKKLFDGDRIAGRIRLEKLYDLHQDAFLAFLESGMSFDQATDKANSTLMLMDRKRLKQLKADFMALMKPAIGVVSDDA